MILVDFRSNTRNLSKQWTALLRDYQLKAVKSIQESVKQAKTASCLKCNRTERRCVCGSNQVIPADRQCRGGFCFGGQARTGKPSQESLVNSKE
jgi:hypothetical protein